MLPTNAKLGKSLFEWGPGHNITTYTIDADTFLETFPTLELTVDMIAYDHFQAGYSDIYYYQINENSGTAYDPVEPSPCDSVAYDNDDATTALSKTTENVTGEEDGMSSNTTKTKAPASTLAPAADTVGDLGADNDVVEEEEEEEEFDEADILESGVDVFGDSVPLMESSAASRTAFTAALFLLVGASFI